MLSVSAPSFSNVGKLPIRLTDSVSCSVVDVPYELCRSFSKGKETFRLSQQVTIQGPKGTLKTDVAEFVKITNDNNTITVSVQDPEHKIQRSLWGTTRAALQNNLIGTLEGHLAICKFVGTGYRAMLETGDNGKQYVCLKVGYPYTPRLLVPNGLTVTLPAPTRLLIEGADIQQVKLFAAVIREHKKPEPYKGKGIFVNNETIRLKEKKIK